MQSILKRLTLFSILLALPFCSGCSCDGCSYNTLANKTKAKTKQGLKKVATYIHDNLKSPVAPLTEKDIEQYIQAYMNIAKVSDEIEKERVKSESIISLTSKSCRALMTKAVQDAGYADLKSFLIMDLRIHYTMRAILCVRIANIAGTAAKDITAENDRKQLKKMNLNEKDQAKVTSMDIVLRSLNSHIGRLGKYINFASEYILKQADLDIVSKHLDDIIAALTNPDLPLEFRHVSGGSDWDWDD